MGRALGSYLSYAVSESGALATGSSLATPTTGSYLASPIMHQQLSERIGRGEPQCAAKLLRSGFKDFQWYRKRLELVMLFSSIEEPDYVGICMFR